MAKDDSSQNSNDGNGDDLTAIKGIGPARQQRLIKVFDVRTFSDLAALSVDQIETALKTEGRLMVARPEIHEWIVQAREFAAVSELASQQVAEPAAAEAEEASNAPAAPEWKPFASFVVEFQARTAEGQAEAYRTTVHHVEADTDQAWLGLDSNALGQWMLAQVHREARPEPEQAERAEALPAEASPVVESDIAIRVTDVHVRQPVGAQEPIGIGQPDQQFPSVVSSAEPFELGVSFEVIGDAARSKIGERPPFTAEFYARNLHTGASLELGRSRPGTLIEGTSSLVAILPSARLPKGAYRIRVLVGLQSTPLPGCSVARVLHVR